MFSRDEMLIRFLAPIERLIEELNFPGDSSLQPAGNLPLYGDEPAVPVLLFRAARHVLVHRNVRYWRHLAPR